MQADCILVAKCVLSSEHTKPSAYTSRESVQHLRQHDYLASSWPHPMTTNSHHKQVRHHEWGCAEVGTSSQLATAECQFDAMQFGTSDLTFFTSMTWLLSLSCMMPWKPALVMPCSRLQSPSSSLACAPSNAGMSCSRAALQAALTHCHGPGSTPEHVYLEKQNRGCFALCEKQIICQDLPLTLHLYQHLLFAFNV